jgi:hypothetical protein
MASSGGKEINESGKISAWRLIGGAWRYQSAFSDQLSALMAVK